MEFIAHHSLDNGVDEAFEAKHLLCISEIGLPVDDVPETMNTLNEHYQLEPFAGDGKQFSPRVMQKACLLSLINSCPGSQTDACLVYLLRK